MRRKPRPKCGARDAERFDDQYRFEVDIGYVAARQRAIELAIVIDEVCVELGIERSTTGVASWGDDRRPPLFWAESVDPDERGSVLMFDCRHFFENDCEQLPASLEAVEGLLVNANETYSNILSISYPSFEHVGTPHDPSTVL